MHPVLRNFIHQYLEVVCVTLAPVVLTAFLSIPYTLEGHPGEPRPADAVSSQHMS
jgi:hypothetical protein